MKIIVFKQYKAFLFFLLLFVNLSLTEGQKKYWVVFKDKKGVSFNPYEYFDQKALARRQTLGLPLFDHSDLPVRQDYIEKIKSITNQTTGTSRWMNAIAVKASRKELKQIKKLDIVKKTVPIALYASSAKKRKDKLSYLSEEQTKLLEKQISRMQGDLFIQNNIDGKGVRIAVFDGGFPGVNTAPAFQHLIKNNQIVKTYDFVKKNEHVYDYMNHGTQVLSCIAGMVDGKKLGLATGAEFLLARTEIKLERFKEEEYWMEAAEWADKNGADIINSSLGYTYHRYFAHEMDGKTTFVTKAANMAASKGILVINAMGNDGDKEWQVLGAPADADSVLSIGGIDPNTDYHISFSSLGPTYDKRLKPNLSAYGKTVVSGKSKLQTAYGTSFATPLVSGFAACVKQLNPSFTNMKLFRELEKSGELYPYYDYAHGYGIPQASYFINQADKSPEPTFEFISLNNILTIEVKDISKIPDSETTLDPLHNYLYYNIKDADEIIKKYAIIIPYQEKVIDFNKNDFNAGDKITVHYQGYTHAYTF